MASRASLAIGRMLLLLAGLVIGATGVAAQQDTTTATPQADAPQADTPTTGLPIRQVQWTGDYRAMVERRAIRILVPPSRTLYFVDAGHERGLSAELARDFERYVNKREKTARRPVTVFLIATPRDRLFSDLVEGKGDIAIGNLTVTPERGAMADFRTGGVADTASEIVVTGPRSPTLARIDDLAGKTIHVRRSSSYHETLTALNARFAAAGRPQIKLVLVPESLEDEDLMEMLEVGIVELLVVDQWKARLWARVLPRIRPREDLRLTQGGRVGWAIRKGSPELAEIIDTFFIREVRAKGIAEQRLASYMRQAARLRDPTRAAAWQRFERTYGLFEKYGKIYGFEPLLLTAQGFQESRLRQEVRSPVGAIGIMQLMPQTGQQMAVGDVKQVEPNVHAGAKFMSLIMNTTFEDAELSELDRALFAFAAYNAGPARIARMRRVAAQRGLDPNVWFGNVEVVVSEQVGAETTGYVRHIFKYYVSYKLQLARNEERRRARDAMGIAR